MIAAVHESNSLAVLAGKINVAFRASDERRIEAGRLLLEARERVGDGQWGKWCHYHIERSRSDIKKCMALARSDDPQAALEKERKSSREGMPRSRAAKAAGHGSVRAIESVSQVYVGKKPVDTSEWGADAKAQVAAALDEFVSRGPQPEIIPPIKPAGNSESDNLETNSEEEADDDVDNDGPYKWWLYDGKHDATGYTLTYDDALHFLWDLCNDSNLTDPYDAEYTKDWLDGVWGGNWCILSLPETDDDGDDWEEAKRSPIRRYLPDECPYISRYDRAMKLLLQLSEMGLQDTEMSTDERTNLRAMLFDVGGCIAADDKELVTGII